MSALLLDLQPGDSVIVPSFTFTSSALAFAREGARILFCDIEPETLGLDPRHVAELLDDSVRAVVLVHYAGIACDVAGIREVLRDRPDVAFIEDNAHGLFGRWHGQPLGSLGRFATLSFHETKNFVCGEGGALVLNEPRDLDRAWVVYDKGTDRRAFFRGQVDKYSWRDTGSSFGLSDMLAAYLFGQLEQRDLIQAKRRAVFDYYLEALEPVRRGARDPAAGHPGALRAGVPPLLPARAGPRDPDTGDGRAARPGDPDDLPLRAAARLAGRQAVRRAPDRVPGHQRPQRSPDAAAVPQPADPRRHAPRGRGAGPVPVGPVVTPVSEVTQSGSSSIGQPGYWWYRARTELLQAALGDFLGHPRRLLDVGSADGPSVAWMRGDFERFAIDLDPRGLAPGRGVCASALALPFADATFDVVGAFDVIEHCEPEALAVAELARVLTPGGRLLCSVPAYQWAWSDHDVRAGHHRRYTRPRLVAALEGAGFTIRRSTYGFAGVFPLFAAERAGRRLRRGAGVANQRLPHVSKTLDRVLTGVSAAEARFLQRHDLPFGSSVFVVAEKPGR